MDKNNTSTFCVLPWIHLATHPIGVVTPCCVSDMENGASNALKPNGDKYILSQDSLEEITNSDTFKKIRKDMIAGKEPAVCKNCYFYEKHNVWSKRKETNQQYQDLIESCFSNTKEDGSLHKIDYRYIELRLGTVCNLKCTTCNASSSSKWNEDVPAFYHTKFRSTYPHNFDKVEWYKDTKFYDELFSHCKSLREMWINGGEPTLIKEHGYFLQKFIDNDTAKNIKLHYSLNVTAFPDKFIELWKQFKHVKIHLSIDDLEKRNHYVRFPSIWKVITTNLTKILKYRDIFELEILQTVSCLNLYNIVNFGKFVDELKLNWVLNFVHYPAHLSVKNIPDPLKQEILKNISTLKEEVQTKIKVELLQERNLEDYADFIEYINLLDTQRKHYIGDYLPEWDIHFKGKLI